MTKTCNYGLPQAEANALTDLVDMAKQMDQDELARLLQAAKAIKLVRELKQLPSPDTGKTA